MPDSSTNDTGDLQPARNPGRAPLWPWAATLLALAILSPLLKEHFNELWQRPFYRWVPGLVIGVAVSLFWQWRRGEVTRCDQSPSSVSRTSPVVSISSRPAG